MVEISGLEILKDVALKDRTTFRVGGPARRFAEVSSPDELRAALVFAEQEKMPLYLLGGGSNLVVSDQGFPGLVIALVSRGVDLIDETESRVTIRAAAGEIWDNVVEYAVGHGWWGIENMSLIPGTVGAVPIQNVGAYGQDASQVVREVEVLEVASKEIRTIPARDCAFAYRKSIFNREDKGRYIVWSVTFSLLKSGTPNLSHSVVRNRAFLPPAGRLDALKRRCLSLFFSQKSPELRQMRNIIIQLRKDGRLPDLERIGNAGSFFQSPFVSSAQIQSLADRFRGRLAPEFSNRLLNDCYHSEDGIVVPVTNLIRVAEMETASVGGAALYPKNPAILINRTGDASALNVLELAGKVRQSVFRMSGLTLPVEPEFVGFDSVELKQFMEIGG